MNLLIRYIARLRLPLGTKFGTAMALVIIIFTLLFISVGAISTYLSQINEQRGIYMQNALTTEIFRTQVIHHLDDRSQAALASMQYIAVPGGAITVNRDPVLETKFNNMNIEFNATSKTVPGETINLKVQNTDDFTTLRKDYNKYEDLVDNMISKNNQDHSPAATITSALTLNAQRDKINTDFTNIRNNQIDQANIWKHESELTSKWIYYSTALGYLIVIFLAIMITYILREIVRHPVKQVLAQLANVALGNLNTQVSVQNGDEIGALASEVNNTITNLRQAIDKLKDESVSVQSAAAEIASISSQQARGSTEQVHALGRLSTTLEEMGQTAHMIAEGARVVVDVAHHALEIGEQGTLAVNHALTGVSQLRNEVINITERILGVNTQAQQVTAVVDIISSIAHTTHLLALNASIEAAGAGEQGTRFSVVASEVKKLARRAQSEAQSVRTLVDQVQQATGTAVMATEQGMKEAEHLTALSEQAGSALNEIMGVLHETTNQAQAIALATQQQQTGSEQMLEAMRLIGQVSKDNSNAATQIAATAQQLNHASVELRESVARFEHN